MRNPVKTASAPLPQLSSDLEKERIDSGAGNIPSTRRILTPKPRRLRKLITSPEDTSSIGAKVQGADQDSVATKWIEIDPAESGAALTGRASIVKGEISSASTIAHTQIPPAVPGGQPGSSNGTLPRPEARERGKDKECDNPPHKTSLPSPASPQKHIVGKHPTDTKRGLTEASSQIRDPTLDRSTTEPPDIVRSHDQERHTPLPRATTDPETIQVPCPSQSRSPAISRPSLSTAADKTDREIRSSAARARPRGSEKIVSPEPSKTPRTAQRPTAKSQSSTPIVHHTKLTIPGSASQEEMKYRIDIKLSSISPAAADDLGIAFEEGDTDDSSTLAEEDQMPRNSTHRPNSSRTRGQTQISSTSTPTRRQCVDDPKWEWIDHSDRITSTDPRQYPNPILYVKALQKKLLKWLENPDNREIIYALFVLDTQADGKVKIGSTNDWDRRGSEHKACYGTDRPVYPLVCDKVVKVRHGQLVEKLCHHLLLPYAVRLKQCPLKSGQQCKGKGHEEWYEAPTSVVRKAIEASIRYYQDLSSRQPYVIDEETLINFLKTDLSPIDDLESKMQQVSIDD